MTALGFVLTVLGMLLANIWGEPWIRYLQGHRTRADYIGGAMAIIGWALMVAGIARWLWQHAP